MRRNTLFMILAVILLSAMACKIVGGSGGTSPGATDTPAIDIAATQSALATAVAAQATSQAAAALANASATAAALIPQATSTAPPIPPTPTGQAAISISATQASSVEATATPAVDSSATQQAQANVGVIEQLYSEGVIASKEGDYHRLDDFNQSFAQIDYYQSWDTGYESENFVLSADVAWESASDTANWPYTGCGIVFSENDDYHLHLAYLGLDGYGVLVRVTDDNNWNELAAQYYKALPIPNGDAKIMLVVYDKKMNLYVNGKQLVNAYDGSLNAGIIGLAVLSGTNKGFGTRCQMTNIDLFIFK